MTTPLNKPLISDKLNIALVQPDISWLDAGKNRLNYTKLLKGVKVHPDLVILPEMFSTGFCTDPGPLAEEMNGETVKWMQETAVSMQTAISGSLIIREGDRFFNRLVFADHSGTLKWYDKRHLFRMAGEEHSFTAGSHKLIVHLGDWRVCLLICYDLRFPVWSRNRGDYDLLVFVSNWPASRKDAWNTLLSARAIENQCYVAGVNRVGTDGNGIVYQGESMVIDARGNVVMDHKPASEGIILASVSLSELNNFRDKFPVWKDWDGFRISK